jgi:adenosine deaminase
VRAAEDPRLLDDLVAAGVALELCPTSNVHLGVYQHQSDVPLRPLVDAGATVALGADDPLLFLSRLTDQYQLARDELGFSDDELADLARSSISASLASESDKATWLAEVDAWLAE